MRDSYDWLVSFTFMAGNILWQPAVIMQARKGCQQVAAALLLLQPGLSHGMVPSSHPGMPRSWRLRTMTTKASMKSGSAEGSLGTPLGTQLAPLLRCCRLVRALGPRPSCTALHEMQLVMHAGIGTLPCTGGAWSGGVECAMLWGWWATTWPPSQQ